MTGTEQIQNALGELVGSKSYGKDCQVWKGYQSGTNLTGWHYAAMFHPGIYYVGSTVTEALDTIAKCDGTVWPGIPAVGQGNGTE